MKKALLLGLFIFAVFALSGCTGHAQIHNVGPSEFSKEIKSGAFVIDVHDPEQPHIPGTDAVIPYTQLRQYKNLLPENKSAPIAIYCNSGHQSGIAKDILKQMGYKDIYNLAAGEQSWRAAGYRVDNTFLGHPGLMNAS